MRCWPSALSLLLLAAAAQAGEVALAQATLERHTLNARFEVSLSDTVSNALDRGIDLSFSFQVRGAQPRENPQSRLSYQPLIRRYVLQRGSSTQAFALKGSALRALGRFDDVVLASDPPAAALTLRLKLDRSELPAPLRLPAYLSSDWRLDSGWVGLK